jgi:hypothetical protein
MITLIQKRHAIYKIVMCVILLSMFAATAWAEPLSESTDDAPDPKIETKPFRTNTEKGEETVCVPLVTSEAIENQEETGNITYECLPPEEVATEPQTDERGSAESRMLKDELLQELGEKKETIIEVPAETVEAARQAGEAPVEEVPTPQVPVAPPEKTKPIKMYASLRLNVNFSEEKTEVSDGASRIGLLALKKDNDLIYTGQIELGVNAFGNLNGIIDGDSNTREGVDTALSLRLLTANVERNRLGVTIGKNWSVFYRAAKVTDRFIVFGAKGTGVFNAGTDGGGSGTGRADNVLQVYSLRKKLLWALQAQYGTEVPGLDETVNYKLNYSAGIRRVWNSGYAVSAAYNRNNPEKFTSEMLQRGLNGDGEASIVAARYSDHRMFFGANYVWLKNQVTDNAGQFFDARGGEIYSRYDVKSNIRVVAGYNYQEPMDDKYTGQFNVRAFIAGAQYTFGNRDFSDMVYVELINDNGRLADGGEKGTIITLGGRYKFDW